MVNGEKSGIFVDRCCPFLGSFVDMFYSPTPEHVAAAADAHTHRSKDDKVSFFL